MLQVDKIGETKNVGPVNIQVLPCLKVILGSTDFHQGAQMPIQVPPAY